ncbi:MAG: hypothetical protein RR584_15905, partial [Comamonas sp.]
QSCPDQGVVGVELNIHKFLPEVQHGMSDLFTLPETHEIAIGQKRSQHATSRRRSSNTTASACNIPRSPQIQSALG